MKRVSLTFDDGPDNKITPKILDILKQNKIKATFFFIGNNIETNRDIVKRAYEEGNLVLNHSFTHKDLPKLTEKAVSEEIKKTNETIKGVIGKEPAIFRPPYGDLNEEVVVAAKNSNVKIALWSLDTLDWLHHDKNWIEQSVLKHVRPGDIILMHSNSDKIATSEALPIVISKLKEQGYEFVDVATMLGINPYN